ncbi:MAG: RHS repeat-associated core domain-containing protein [Flavobacteriaceae bacterium]|nr:RHS repeat-associated core domain-containing protein [Flavobacteriaceae bacterium]
MTNLEGEVVQHLEYVPFGEVFIESKNARWNTPYKFNAKELDEETGLYYYGARYYNPKVSLWLSVDPLAEVVAENRSPYEYTYSNPIKYIDPTGMAPEGGIGDPPIQTIQLSNVTVYGKRKRNSWTSESPLSGVVYQGTNACECTLSQYNSYTGQNFQTHQEAADWYQQNSDDAYNQAYMAEFMEVRSVASVAVLQGMGELVGNVMTVGEAGLIYGGLKTLAKQSAKIASVAAKKPKVVTSLTKNIRGGAAKASNFLKGGKTFSQYKASYWSGRVKPTLDPIINPKTGQVWKQYTELHHRFIPQRASWAPKWLINNRLNLMPVSSLRHAQIDPYRARFAPKWVKEMYNLKWK